MPKSKEFKRLVEYYRDDIVRKWVDFFVYNKEVVSEKIIKKRFRTMVVSIKKADYIGEYKINFMFSDGVEKTVDFGSFLQHANNPMTKKYRDKNLFQSFAIEYGDIT